MIAEVMAKKTFFLAALGAALVAAKVFFAARRAPRTARAQHEPELTTRRPLPGYDADEIPSVSEMGRDISKKTLYGCVGDQPLVKEPCRHRCNPGDAHEGPRCEDD
ncbi:hypothetical protein PCL_06817 [Purpureocillium lilacinum]|uniref:Uncharacterized protein n=1 Tax=Purpureocillium lilacinum TaxID=33203 RepID=A0A2U3DTN5_PURLI|nr:hypothetical protein Purlil1_9594 [Purpureocillium lilacinum]PWI65612.1 hypothetical protein PCL_06817 [Purpureocillium lilacinum]